MICCLERHASARGQYMSYQVLTGGGGLAGWTLLNKTATRQRDLVAADGAVVTATNNFRTKIGGWHPRMICCPTIACWNVALRAFGLEGDIGNRGFIRKVWKVTCPTRAVSRTDFPIRTISGWRRRLPSMGQRLRQRSKPALRIRLRRSMSIESSRRVLARLTKIYVLP